MSPVQPAMSPATPARRLPFAARFYHCGRVALEDCLLLQQRLAYDALTRNDGRATVLLCEHPTVLTIGRLGSRVQARIEGRELAARGVPVRFVPRGEGALWHAPGQLALYVVLHLPWRWWSLGDYLERLHGALRAVCNDVGVAAISANAGEPPGPGVWCDSGKLAAVAVALRDGVTTFGGVLNVGSPLVDQQRIIPCLWADGGRHAGLPGAGLPARWTSLSAARAAANESRAQTAPPVTMQTVQERLLHRLSEQLGCPQPLVEQGHPQLPEAEEIVRRAAA